MRGGSKTLIAAVVALLLAAGLVACGGGDDSTTGATSAEPAAPASGGNASDGEEQSSDSGEGGSGELSGEHQDSGGGSDQYLVKGGDNSIQEFGGEADEDEFESAAEALHGFLDARAEGDWETACEYVAESVTTSLEELAKQAKEVQNTDCAGILGALTNPAAKGVFRKEAEKADIGSLRVEGEGGYAIYRGADGKSIFAMPMAKEEDGEWKVAGLAPTTLF